MHRIILLLLLIAPQAWTGEPLRIAVAANFRGTLEPINEAFTRDSGQQLLVSSASTGILATQISQGAPFHLFFAADREAPAKLAENSAGDAPFCYALGQLALVGGGLSELANPRLNLAIANPATAPYGRAAQEVLARPEFAAGAGRKLVRGNNVVQAYQYWHSGAVELALVARALVGSQYVEVPAQWHQPLEQHALVVAPHPALDAYLKWIRSDTVRQMILDAGYQTCP